MCIRDRHLDVLSRLSTMLMDADFKNKLISAKSKEEFLNIINETENVKFKELIFQNLSCSHQRCTANKC